MNTTNVYTKRTIDTSKFVDTTTAEPLFSAFPNTTSVNVRDPDLKIVDYDEFIIIDSKALNYIQNIFSNTDLAKILKLTNMVKGCYNLLHNLDGKVHTPITLRQSLVIGESEFSKLMKRLHEKSIISYMSSYKNRKKCKWIMLNPTLARKSKMFHKDCLVVFDDLTKKSAVNS